MLSCCRRFMLNCHEFHVSISISQFVEKASTLLSPSSRVVSESSLMPKCAQNDSPFS